MKSWGFGRNLIGLVSLEEEKYILSSLFLHTHNIHIHMDTGKVMWVHNKKVAIHKPGRETSPKTNPNDTLILDS